jgi:mannose-6-phosphate isomerase-like protein (cupin superfamily)
MNAASQRTLVLDLRHTGERLELRRIRSGAGVEEIHLEGSLPPQRQGPPLHVHFAEDEHGEVLSGTLSASVDGRELRIKAGEAARFPRGSAHRWWNGGDTTVVFRGVATPAADLDRFLQALFEVINAGPDGRPSLFYLAHVLHRHRRSQLALVMPRMLQRVLLPLVVLMGTTLGRYRGDAWPGCPTRCTGAALEEGGPFRSAVATVTSSPPPQARADAFDRRGGSQSHL